MFNVQIAFGSGIALSGSELSNNKQARGEYFTLYTRADAAQVILHIDFLATPAMQMRPAFGALSHIV